MWQSSCLLTFLGEKLATGHIQLQGGTMVNNTPAVQEMQEMWVQPLGQEDPLA